MIDSADIRATVEDYVRRWNAGDAAAMGELFHPDATVADPVDQDPHRGREAIVAFFDGTFTDGMDATLALTGPIRVAGAHAAFPMQVTIDLGEQTGHLDIIDTMTFADDGLITTMNAYWDATAMEFS